MPSIKELILNNKDEEEKKHRSSLEYITNLDAWNEERRFTLLRERMRS